jgi:molybdenum cofactor cytidylyltransferase
MIASIVLAAGSSRRMGSRNKLLRPFRGRPLLRWPVDAALAAALGPVVVVTGHERAPVEAALPEDGVIRAHNPDFGGGMASSLACGLRAVPQDALGALILLADMPLVAAGHLTALADAFRAAGGNAIVVPVHNGARGHPVLFPRTLFPELRAITGDRGGKAVIAAHPDLVRELACADDAILRDIDTPEDLAAF